MCIVGPGISLQLLQLNSEFKSILYITMCLCFLMRIERKHKYMQCQNWSRNNTYFTTILSQLLCDGVLLATFTWNRHILSTTLVAKKKKKELWFYIFSKTSAVVKQKYSASFWHSNLFLKSGMVSSTSRLCWADAEKYICLSSLSLSFSIFHHR